MQSVNAPNVKKSKSKLTFEKFLFTSYCIETYLVKCSQWKWLGRRMSEELNFLIKKKEAELLPFCLRMEELRLEFTRKTVDFAVE